MKDNRGNGFVSFFIMVTLLIAIIFFGYIIYQTLFNEQEVSIFQSNSTVAVDTGIDGTTKVEKRNIGDTIKEIFTTQEDIPSVTYSTQESQGKYFYEQLNDTEKEIYNGLQESKDKMMSGTYVIQYGSKFSSVLEQENGSKILGDNYQSAIEAFTHDNPDLFYLNVSSMYLNIETKKTAFSKTYNVYIQPEEGSTYMANGFNSETEVRIAKQNIENEANNLKKRFTGNAYKDTKIIHDYLIENVKYDEGNKSIGSYTIYGALVGKRCVCEGYAKAFKYLADKAGIENVLMQGIAVNSEGIQEKHAWNAVNINNSWYLVDVTWDDPIIIGKGTVSSNIHYKYFLKGSNNFYKDHKIEYKFTENGKTFKFPTISISDY